ncbi:uncharacterized protein EKO05_0007206 [Ascochyta rabiei]|uniref:uncharacterized protein n=1 Tax=Didymella rabiei TaxID=5454 RepID=UPI00190121BE|nr:uncharacterized protein EKO05_0007206 [Ascochyta rabiei]UPX16823.1 hypothetical protein EKO05_0007206 [Ascochyta rabiei]
MSSQASPTKTYHKAPYPSIDNVATTLLKNATAYPVIVEVTSAAAHLTIAPDFAAYNISKMATARFYTSLALDHPELAVYFIQPGTVETEMNKNAGYKKEGEEGRRGRKAGARQTCWADLTMQACRQASMSCLWVLKAGS